MSADKNKIYPENQPLVAIGIPVYNGERYITEALESINNQTYANFECHIVNNASNDKTEELVRNYIKNKSRFKLHTYSDFVDVVYNWNRTVDHIPQDARYFKLVQADDYLFPDSIKSHVDLMELHPNAGIGSSYRLKGNQIVEFGIDYFEGNCYNGKDILIKQLTGNVHITGSITQLFFRIEHLKKVPGYPVIFNPEEMHFDTHLANEILGVSDLVFVFQILNYNRKHADSLTKKLCNRVNTHIHSKEFNLYRFKDISPEVKDRYGKIRREYAYFLFKSYLRNDRESIQWHKKHLKRKMKFSEYLTGILLENRFFSKLEKLAGK